MKRLLFLISLSVAVWFVACGSTDDNEPASTSPTDTTAKPAAGSSPSAVPSTAAEVEIPDGWLTFSVGEVSVSAPGTFVGGASAEETTFSAIRDAGGGCIAVADLFEPAKDTIALLAVDSATCDTSSIHSISLIPGQVPSDVDTPEEFIEAFIPGLPATAELLSQETITIAGEPAAVLTVRRTYQTGINIQRIWAIGGSGGAWALLAVAATEADFQAAAPGFDAIAQTFRITE